MHSEYSKLLNLFSDVKSQISYSFSRCYGAITIKNSLQAWFWDWFSL